MNIQIFGKAKSFDTKKAERYFKERRIKFQSVDIIKYGMSKGEFESVRRAVGLDAMIDANAKGADDIFHRLEIRAVAQGAGKVVGRIGEAPREQLVVFRPRKPCVR